MRLPRTAGLAADRGMGSLCLCSAFCKSTCIGRGLGRTLKYAGQHYYLAVSASPVRRFSRGLADALRLPRTAARIVEILARSRRQMSVQEIVRRVRMSERSVGGNLALLVRRGILDKRAVATAKKPL